MAVQGFSEENKIVGESKKNKNQRVFEEPTEIDPKGWRFHRIQAFLTYPNSKDLSKEDLYKIINERYPIAKYAIGLEKHASGENHLHAYFKFHKTIDSIKVDLFDVDGHHPNVGSIQTVDGCVEYCTKGSDYIIDGSLDRWTTSRSFSNKMKDFSEWRIYRDTLGQQTCYPFKLPTGAVVNKPTLSDKKNNYSIIGKPDCGKTKWANDVFENKKVLVRTCSDTSWEGYTDQEVILYDDFYPPLSELIHVSNVWKLNVETPVRCRYRPRYMKKNERRTIILLNNNPPDYALEPAFLARFNILNIRKDQITYDVDHFEIDEITDDISIPSIRLC